MKTKTNRAEWYVYVTYIEAHNNMLDQRIEKKARRTANDKKTFTGIRYLVFFFKNRDSAYAAAKRIRSLRTHSTYGNYLTSYVKREKFDE